MSVEKTYFFSVALAETASWGESIPQVFVNLRSQLYAQHQLRKGSSSQKTQPRVLLVEKTIAHID